MTNQRTGSAQLGVVSWPSSSNTELQELFEIVRRAMACPARCANPPHLKQPIRPRIGVVDQESPSGAFDLEHATGALRLAASCSGPRPRRRRPLR